VRTPEEYAEGEVDVIVALLVGLAIVGVVYYVVRGPGARA
jgi:hypothetical protein